MGDKQLYGGVENPTTLHSDPYWVNWRRVVAINKGPFDQNTQDYLAVLVFDAGGKLETFMRCETALTRWKEANQS